MLRFSRHGVKKSSVKLKIFLKATENCSIASGFPVPASCLTGTVHVQLLLEMKRKQDVSLPPSSAPEKNHAYNFIVREV